MDFDARDVASDIGIVRGVEAARKLYASFAAGSGSPVDQASKPTTSAASGTGRIFAPNPVRQDV
jgi:hypothetical protein